MRMIHPIRLPALLVAAALATAPAAAQNGAVAVDASHLDALQSRLAALASALSPAERAAWDRLLLRAAGAPQDDAAGVRVTPVLEIGPGGGCDGGMDDATGRVAIIVQGGRSPSSGIIVQGGRTPASRGGTIVPGGRTPGGTAQGAGAPRPTPTGTVAIGPKQDDPGAPRPGRTGTVAIGPKQDDPGAPRPGRTGTVAIGPKQDDPAPPPQSLGRRIAELSSRLSAEERGALNWLLTRAAAAPEGRPGTPGGMPPGTSVSLRQALGIDALAIGPKQDDPAPRPPTQRWMLRY